MRGWWRGISSLNPEILNWVAQFTGFTPAHTADQIRSAVFLLEKRSVRPPAGKDFQRWF